MGKMSRKIRKYLLVAGLLCAAPFTVNAQTPGARSATSSAGDVFLGGNFIEVGISKSGSFGTSMAAPEEFHSHALSQYNYALGLIADGDGWDVGNEPTSGDFFLPGSPYEGYIFKYTMNGKDYTYNIAERSSYTWDDKYLTAPTVVDQSDVEKGKLKALFTVVTKENVKLEMTIEFGEDDIYYSTLVNVTNLSSNEITNVSFTRDLDPDNDKDLNNTFDTYNKVVCNPNPNQEGSDSNYAMVVSAGPVTYNGFFFISFDNRAKGTISNNAPSDLPTSATDADLAISADNTNGYLLADSNIQMSTSLKSLKANESDSTVYYSSLDPNVISSMSKILKAVSAKVKKYTDTRIEVETKEGYEYSIDNGAHWQDSGVFENLKPGKQYTVLSRIKATGDAEASEPEETVVTTKKSSPKTPNIEALNVTEDSITVQNMENYEYSIDGGKTWQNSPEFTGLKPNTEYEIIARYVETASTMYGTLTNPIKFKTLVKEETELDKLDNVDIKFEYNNDSPIIIINKGLLFESIKNNEVIQDAIENNNDVDIKFIINSVELDDSIEEKVNGKLNADEKVGFIADVVIKVYVNDDYVKDITETEKDITFKIKIPSNMIKKGRTFYALRFHMNESDKLEIERLSDMDKDDSTITIKSNKFSDYIVTYVDAKKSAVGIENPATGDSILKHISVFFFSLVAAIGLYKNKEKVMKK